MTSNRYGVLAVAIILFCIPLGVFAFPVFAFAGFSLFHVAWYLMLLTSIAASFYLLAKRRELAPSALRRVAIVAVASLLVVVAPMLIGLAYALNS